MIARVWYDKADDSGHPWRIRYADGALTRAEQVTFEYAETLFREEAFLELPGGPRGILEGELSRVTGEVPA